MNTVNVDNVVQKNILDILQKDTLPKKQMLQKESPVLKSLKKKMSDLHATQKKQTSTLKKELKKSHTTLKKHLEDVHREVTTGKTIYASEPKQTLENQLLIDSMNRLTGIVKQLVALFHQKISEEEGPLFTKLNEIMEQNEKIAEGILAVANLVKEEKTVPAKILPINPYLPKVGPAPLPLQQQMPTQGEMLFPSVPQDMGKYQNEYVQQPPKPIWQNPAPIPPYSQTQPEEKPLTPKRTLF